MKSMCAMRKQKAVCPFCGSGKLEVGDPFCDGCGQPTGWASYDERVRFELDRWLTSRERSVEVAPEQDPGRGRRSLLDVFRRPAARAENGATAPTREPSAPPPQPPVPSGDRAEQERVAAILAKLASYATGDQADAPAFRTDPREEVAHTRAQIRRLQQRLEQLEAQLGPVASGTS